MAKNKNYQPNDDQPNKRLYIGVYFLLPTCRLRRDGCGARTRFYVSTRRMVLYYTLPEEIHFYQRRTRGPGRIKRIRKCLKRISRSRFLLVSAESETCDAMHKIIGARLAQRYVALREFMFQ